MASTSRERVYQALQFEGPDRAPRNLWSLPWAELHFPEALKKIRDDFPDDLGARLLPGKPQNHRERVFGWALYGPVAAYS